MTCLRMICVRSTVSAQPSRKAASHSQTPKPRGGQTPCCCLSACHHNHTAHIHTLTHTTPLPLPSSTHNTTGIPLGGTYIDRYGKEVPRSNQGIFSFLRDLVGQLTKLALLEVEPAVSGSSSSSAQQQAPSLLPLPSPSLSPLPSPPTPPTAGPRHNPRHLRPNTPSIPANANAIPLDTTRYRLDHRCIGSTPPPSEGPYHGGGITQAGGRWKAACDGEDEENTRAGNQSQSQSPSQSKAQAKPKPSALPSTYPPLSPPFLSLPPLPPPSCPSSYPTSH